MTRPPDPRRDLEERRNARIRRVRAERGTPNGRRRTFQPVVLLAWFAGVIALAGVLLFLGFVAFSPRLMVWIEDHPGSIEQGIVRDFVQWYQPQALADEPASDDGGRITVTIEDGASDAEIGELLWSEGLIKSRLAFQWAVMQADARGSLQAGTYDLSPSLRPSDIVAALRQEAGEEVGDHPPGGLAAGGDRRLPGHHQPDHEPGAVRLAGDRSAPGRHPRPSLPGRPARGPHAGGLPGAEHLPDLPERLRPRGAGHAADRLRRQPHRQDAGLASDDRG